MIQCFVVCPFGSKVGGEEDRLLFAELAGLREHVFGPAEAACLQRGVPVKISDAREIEHGKSRIKDAVQKCIDEAAVVIIVLSANKPNVYLELGWAQGMWQTPILLKNNCYTIPVDINNDLRLTFHSGDVDGSDRDGAAALAQELADKILNQIRLGRRTKQFEHWPDTTLARGAVHVYNRFSRAIDFGEWHRVVDSARDRIVVASASMSRLLNQSVIPNDPTGTQGWVPISQLLLRKATEGVSVTILLYHGDNLDDGHLKRSEQITLGAAREEFAASSLGWFTLRRTFETLRLRDIARNGEQAESARGSFRVVQMRRRNLPFRVTLTESRVLLTLRFYTEGYNSGLCIDALAPVGPVDRNNLPVHTQVQEELDFLIAENDQASEDAYQSWAQTRSA